VLIRYYEGHACNIRSSEDARRSLDKWSTYFAEQVVSDITSTSIEGFVKSLAVQGHSEGYIGRILRVGKAALNRAYKLDEIASVPYVPSGSIGGVRERVLSLEESAALFNAVESDHLLMYLLIAYNTLARPEAILELKKFQVNFDDRIIQLNPPGREQTKKLRPTLPITDTLFPWLEKSKVDVFVNWKGRPIKSIRTAFQLTRDRAGLGKDVTPYTIRHTMATELRRRQVQQWELAGFLGHSSGSTTERYAKFAPDYMSNARIAIDEYFLELQPFVKRTLVFKKDLRANCVLVGE
jgi:integrase